MDAQNHKQQLLEQLYAPYQQCMQCPLGSLGRTKMVFGDGNPDARLMLIGEAPGKDEDEQGKPFVGRSGKLLTQVLEALGLNRQTIYITNIIKCRPPDNRKPTPTESSTCKNILLLNQIKIIRPKVVCTLGASSLQGLLAKDAIQITKIRGIPLTFEDTILVPTYHPAYILRNPKELKFLEQDLKLARDLANKQPPQKTLIENTLT